MVPVVWTAAEDSASRHLIIQPILLDPSGALWTDEAGNASRLDPAGADQADAEHQATDVVAPARFG
jgi:hypothetical protein